jgi:hypothetical protein
MSFVRVGSTLLSELEATCVPICVSVVGRRPLRHHIQARCGSDIMQVLEPRPHRWIRLTTDAQIRSPAAHTVPHSCTFHPHRSSFAELARSYALSACTACPLAQLVRLHSLSARTARLLSSACSHSALGLLVRIREAGTHTLSSTLNPVVRSNLGFAQPCRLPSCFVRMRPLLSSLRGSQICRSLGSLSSQLHSSSSAQLLVRSTLL